MSYFEDRFEPNYFSGGNRRPNYIKILKTGLARYPKQFFRNDAQIVRLLEKIPDTKVTKRRFQALVLMVERIQTEDLRKFDGTKILEVILFDRPSCRLFLETKGVPVSQIEYNKFLEERRKIAALPLESVDVESESSDCDEHIETRESRQQQQQELPCLICHSFIRRVIFKECGHLALCRQCALQHNFQRCLVCQRANNGLQAIFF